MTNEELNESVQGYLRRKDSLVQLKEQKQPEALEPSLKGNNLNFGYIYAIPWFFVIAFVSSAGKSLIFPGIGILILMLMLHKWTKEGEEIVRNETKLNLFKTQKKKKILFEEENSP